MPHSKLQRGWLLVLLIVGFSIGATQDWSAGVNRAGLP